MARTAQEIQRDMRANLTGQEAGLVGYWPISEGQGAVARDQTPNALHLTLSNGPQWIAAGR